MPNPPPTSPALRLGVAPRLYVIDGFLTAAEIVHVLDVAADRDALVRRGAAWKHDETGFSFEMQIGGDPLLEAIRARIARITGLRDRAGTSFRFRHYGETEAHGPHLDTYRIAGNDLAVTALIHLVDTEAGGATRFPNARPEPVEVAPRAGRLVVWGNLLADGTPDPASLHEGLPVHAGAKMTLTEFVYVGSGDLAAGWGPERSAR